MAAAVKSRTIGRYELWEEFARGGMASVHRGRLVGPAGFARTVAIKRLQPGFASDPSIVRMFMDEARLASRLTHPNLVPIVDTIALEGELYLVMDYVRGLSLSRLVMLLAETNERVPLAIALGIMVGVFAGLHAAHEATGEDGLPLEIVHRDVSPQNIVVGVDGVARVLDFGVAKAASRLQSTAEGQVKGKIAYMSPEQLNGHAVDRRSDVYSGGVVLWELLVGSALFAREDVGAVVAAVMQGEVEPPKSRVADLPPDVDALVVASLDRDREKRPRTALEVVRALEAASRVATAREVADWLAKVAPDVLASEAAALAVVENAELGTAPGHVDDAAPPVSSSANDPEPAIVAAPPSGSRWRAIALAAIPLGVAAGIVVALAIGRSSPSPQAAPSELVTASSAPPASAAGSREPTESAEPLPAPTSKPSGGAGGAAGVSRPHASGGPRPKVAPKSPALSRTDCRVVNPDGTLGYRPECLK